MFNEKLKAFKNFKFDQVIDPSWSQNDVYENTEISKMVKHVLDGYHATIFAYGQTGSGKTFTMEGYKYMQNEKGIPIPEIEINENNGIIPRAIDDLFD